MAESLAETMVSPSLDRTLEIARTLGNQLIDGDVVLLYGELGSGKTVFAQGLAEAHGVPGSEVQSPTYTLIHEYRVDRQGVPTVIHIDLYRLDAEEIELLGMDELLAGPAIKIVEWADRLGWQPEDAWIVRITQVAADQREIKIERTRPPGSTDV